MDIVSQLLLGISISYVFFHTYLGMWGYLTAIVCILLMDIPPLFSHPHLFHGMNHAQGFSHSIWMLVLLLLIALPIGHFFLKRALSLCLLCISIFMIHVVVDMSSSGVALFYPLFDISFALQSVSRFDPLILLVLSSGLLLSFFTMRSIWCKTALIIFSLYILLAHIISLYAYQTLAPVFVQIGYSKESIHLTTPPLFSFVRRLSVRNENKRFACTFFSPFQKRIPEIYTKESIQNAFIDNILQSENGIFFKQFTQDMILVERQKDRFVFLDARHGSFLDPWDSPFQGHVDLQKEKHTLIFSPSLPRPPFRDEIPQGWEVLFPKQAESR